MRERICPQRTETVTDFLGRASIDLADLEPFQLKTVNVPLDGKSGEIKLKLLFRPTYVTRTRRGTSTFGGGAGRIVTGLAGAPVEVVGEGVKTVGKGVGAAAGGISGAASFVKRGFTRKKTTIAEDEEEDITPKDVAVAKDGVASGGGIKVTSDGTQSAVTGDNKETPLNTDPYDVNSDDVATTPSQGFSGHQREMSIMSNETGNGGESGLLQIAVVEGKGFPSGKDVRVVLKTPQKEFYKSKAVKSTEPTWYAFLYLIVLIIQECSSDSANHCLSVRTPYFWYGQRTGRGHVYCRRALDGRFLARIGGRGKCQVEGDVSGEETGYTGQKDVSFSISSKQAVVSVEMEIKHVVDTEYLKGKIYQ